MVSSAPRDKALALTKEQKKQLQAIETEARAKALATLTDEQREQLGGTPSAPEPMMNMCKEMMEMMQGMMSGSDSPKVDKTSEKQ